MAGKRKSRRSPMTVKQAQMKQRSAYKRLKSADGKADRALGAYKKATKETSKARTRACASRVSTVRKNKTATCNRRVAGARKKKCG